MLEEIKYKLKRKLFRKMEAYDITLDELKEKQMKGAEIIDVRNKREYDESHILGSINVPEYQINESFEKIVPNKNKEIVDSFTSTIKVFIDPFELTDNISKFLHFAETYK